jgi:hypothetical protein
LKRLVTTALATAALLLVAVPGAMAAGAGEGEVTVMVMKHACNPDVKNLDDFNAIKESADGPVAALAATVLACPTIVNPGDDTSDGVKGDAVSFAFTLEDAEGTHELPASTSPAKLCETDLGLDADGDGEISEDVCLDTTHYVFEGVTNGEVHITETEPPAGHRFGELLFTPSVIDGNNDADSLVSIDRDAGVIHLDTTADEDGMIMLHVYNFQVAMPDSATEALPGSSPSNFGPLLLLVFLGGFGALWFASSLRRRETTSN